MDLNFTRGRMLFEVFTIIGQAGEVLRLNVIQGIGQGHFTMAMMMAVRFAVCSDVDQLIPLTPVVKSRHQPAG